MEEDNKRLASLQANLHRRALILDYIRAFFHEQGFLEVETPVRVPVVAPELYIVPFSSEGWFLATSPELYMKRMLASGYERIFQISHCFRRDERGRLHNPEFTMIEWYRANSNYMQMVSDTEQLVFSLANKLGNSSRISYAGKEIDLTPPWPRLKIRDAYVKWAGWDPFEKLDSLRFDTDLVDKVIPAFSGNRPTVLLDYPSEMASLARLKRGTKIAERTEIFIGGLELANAYSELIDPKEQEARFKKEIEQIQQERGQKVQMPEKFIKSMKDMPPCSGIALGIDRLVMLLCGVSSIDEVMAFTTDTA